MAQNIGLKITLGGVSQVITDIQKLEQAVNGAKQQLGGLQIGSDEFKKLQREIRVADSELKKLKESSEGAGFEKQFGEFAKFTGAIGAGFAAATAAVSLWGGETEKVSEAAAKAQNVLTLALGARAVGEGIVASRTVALTIATNAQTVANNIANFSFKALFATMVANPFGAILAVIGLVVAAIYALSDSTEDATQSQDEYNAAIQRTEKLQSQYVELLVSQGATEQRVAQQRVKDAQTLLNESQKRLNELRKENQFSKETAAQRDEVRTRENTLQIAQNNLERQINEDRKKRAEDQKRLSDQRRQEREKEYEQEKQFLDKLVDTELKLEEAKRLRLKADVPEPKVIQDLEKLVAANETLSNVIDTTTVDELFATFREGPPALNAAAEGVDIFGKSFLEARKILSLSALGIEGDFLQVRKSVVGFYGELLQSGEITKEAFDAVVGIVNSYDVLNTQFGKEGLGGFFDVKEYYKRVKDYKVANGEIVKDFTETGEVIQASSPFDPITAEENLKRYTEQQLEGYTKFVVQLINADKQFKTENVKIGEDIQTAAERIARERLKTVQESSDLIIQEEQNIIDFYDRSTELQLKRRKTQVSAEIGLVAQNADKIIEELKKVYSLDSQEFEVALDERLKFLTEGRELTDEELEKLAELYRIFYEKINKQRQDNQNEDEKNRQEFIDGIVRDIGYFQSVLNSLSQTASDFYALQFEKLDQENKKVLDSIVGNTEQANQKRLDQETVYNNKVKELQKKQAKFSLQINLAQAIANTAVAITEAFKAGPILGTIAAGIVAALNAVQIGIISNQISALNNFQRGGMIRGQGGMVVGPSHEYGGVKFAYGGGIELEGGESVINRVSSIRYQDLLSSVNMVGGGKPLNTSGGFDDSRILEALAKQRQEPIRAYVLEGDITSSQNVQRKLEQISSF